MKKEQFFKDFLKLCKKYKVNCLSGETGGDTWISFEDEENTHYTFHLFKSCEGTDLQKMEFSVKQKKNKQFYIG